MTQENLHISLFGTNYEAWKNVLDIPKAIVFFSYQIRKLYTSNWPSFDAEHCFLYVYNTVDDRLVIKENVTMCF